MSSQWAALSKALPVFPLSIKYLYTLTRWPLSFLHQTIPALLASSIHHPCGPLLDLFQYVHLSSAEQRGRMKAHLPRPADDALPKAAQDPVGVLDK